MAPNLRDIARAARVSPTTVSRVLNGFQFVSDDVRKRVEDAIRDYGYRPNIHARRLNRKDINTLCYVLSNREVLHTIHSRVFMGMVDYCAGHGLHTLFVSAHYSGDVTPDGLHLPPVLNENGVIQGAVLGGINYGNMLEALTAREMPHAVLGNTLDGKPSAESRVACFDEAEGAQRAVGHLVALGHVSICFIGDMATPWGKARHAGYVKGMENAGLTPLEPIALAPASSRSRQANTPEARPSVDQAALDLVRASMDAVHGIASAPIFPSAMVCANDNVAYGVVEAVRSLGLRIPDDVSVVGFDDSEAAIYCNPPLTTCAVPWEELGRTAARMVLPATDPDMIADRSVVLPVELVSRGSTGPAKHRDGIRRAGMRS